MRRKLNQLSNLICADIQGLDQFLDDFKLVINEARRVYPGLNGLKRMRDLFIDCFSFDGSFRGLTDDLSYGFTNSVGVISTDLIESQITGPVVALPLASIILVNEDRNEPRPYLFNALYNVLKSRANYPYELGADHLYFLQVVSNAVKSFAGERVFYDVDEVDESDFRSFLFLDTELKNPVLKPFLVQENVNLRTNYFLDAYEVACEMDGLFSDLMLYPVYLQCRGRYEFINLPYLQGLVDQKLKEV